MTVPRERLDGCRVLWVSDRFRLRTPLVPHVLALLHAGLPGLVLRERDLAEAPFEDMARHLRDAATQSDALLLVTDRVDVARRAGADGVHLGGRGPSAESARRALGESALLGVSLHAGDDPTETIWREADYFFLSPIYATASKPGVPALSLEGLARFCERARRPVFALGGLTPPRAAACRAQGAHGVAVVGALSDGETPARLWAPWAALTGELADSRGGF